MRFDLAKAGAKDVRVGMAGVREGNTVIVREHDLVPRADLAVELFDDGHAARRAAYSRRARVDARHAAADGARRGDPEARARRGRLPARAPSRAGDVPAPEGGLDLAIVDRHVGRDRSARRSRSRARRRRRCSRTSARTIAPSVWAGDAGLRPVVAERRRASRRSTRPGAARGPRGASRRSSAAARPISARCSAEAAAALDPARRGAIVYIGDGVAHGRRARRSSISARASPSCRGRCASSASASATAPTWRS